MRTRSQTGLAALQTEGAILPADLLRRISGGDATLGGLDPASFHLGTGERLPEAVSRSWSRLQGAWAAFQGARLRLPDSDIGTTLTREKWLLPLFHELGYGRLPSAKPITIDEKSYPVSHGWQHAPIHLVSFRADLDKRQPGTTGASRTSPHSLLQELLNRSDEYLWGFVTNGLRLRLLRDNASLARQAFVEFDLEAIFDGELFADFALLWLLCHQSRVEAEIPEECWLEKWSKSAKEQGTRALDRLRAGVEEAITALGTGLLAHPANGRLRESLQTGTLPAQDFYRELLRLAYRLIFLFVAEDRDLLHVPGGASEARARYARFFSTRRLRTLSLRLRGSRHGDLFTTFRLVTSWLGSDEGRPEFALPALGGLLFSRAAVLETGDCEIANRAFLAAVRALSFTQEGGVRRVVDYKNLGAEELGSIYESLLELHPRVNVPGSLLALETTPGHERKTTSSYYTHPRLVGAALDEALDPLLDEAGASPNPETALLALRVCDLACGSGHFLIAAAHRIARRLASVRTGEAEPSPDVVRSALREVIGRCIYGVDLNPMAVELCKVSLWMEALEPGKPLGFLDHHIRCGNALVGSTPDLIAAGIPDAAYDAFEWDDGPHSRKLKIRNKGEREGLGGLFADLERAEAELLQQAAGVVSSAREDSIIEVRAKETRFRRLTESDVFKRQQALADTWTASFFLQKMPDLPAPTTEDLRALAHGGRVPDALLAATGQAAAKFGFFHWHIAFPEVFGTGGGFDVVFGNPPWDTLSPDTKEFFSPWDPAIRNADSKTQEAIIERLVSSPDVAAAWEEYCRRLYIEAHFYKTSGRFRMFAPGNLGKGDFNIYRMFVESALQLSRPGGYAAQIVPENLYNGANAMAIRKALFEDFTLTALFGFENTKEVWFKGIDSRAKFCLYAARKMGRTTAFKSAFSIRTENRLTQVLAGAQLEVPVALVPEFSPDALAVMEFSSQLEIDIARKMYSRWPKFGDRDGGLPYRQYMAEVHMGNDRELFAEDPAGVPVYEGRMVGQFDHRAKAYRSGRGREAEWQELLWDQKAITPQWFIPEEKIPAKVRQRYQRYRVGFCDVASPTNERSLVAALVPAGAICGHKVPTIIFDPAYDWAHLAWLAVANSFCLDYLVRKKVSLTMSLSLLDSLPIPRFDSADRTARLLVQLAAVLTCTGPEMSAYWDSLASSGWLPVRADGGVPGLMSREDRAAARAEIDAIVARDIYGLTKDELSFILDGFPIVKKDDEREVGTYRTKEMVLAAYEQPARADGADLPTQP